jgi:hypothetical protein
VADTIFYYNQDWRGFLPYKSHLFKIIKITIVTKFTKITNGNIKNTNLLFAEPFTDIYPFLYIIRTGQHIQVIIIRLLLLQNLQKSKKENIKTIYYYPLFILVIL